MPLCGVENRLFYPVREGIKGLVTSAESMPVFFLSGQNRNATF